MERLGAQTKAHRGIGAEHRAHLCAEHRGDPLLGRRVRGYRHRAGGREIEHAKHLRPLVPDHCPRPSQGLREPAHVVVAAGRQELDLDLVEAGPGRRLVVDRDDIVEDVRNGDVVAEHPPAQAARAKRGHGAERRPAEVRRKQLGCLGRRLCPAAGKLDLEPAALGWQLQLPAHAARARPPAKGDSRDRQAMVGRVVIRRDERDGAQALTGQLREQEPLCHIELALALELVDSHPQSLRNRCKSRPRSYPSGPSGRRGMPSPGFEPGTPALGEPRSIP